MLIAPMASGMSALRRSRLSDFRSTHGISLCDAEGHEVAWIDDLAELPSGAAVGSRVAHREFLPQIRRIVRVSLETDPCEWEVETDRGPTKFVLKSEEDVRRLDDNGRL